MKTDPQNLERKLSLLGFPLLEASPSEDVHATLAEVVQSQDTRYWEGFPVLLANAAKQAGFRLERVEQLLPGNEAREQFKQLFLLSLALYESLNLRFAWTAEWQKRAPRPEILAVKEFQKKLAAGEPLEAAGRQFLPSRLNDLFTQYYENEAARAKSLAVKQEAFSLEYALSQVFSPKQKELFKKKLNGEVLTKTEKEYFSRAVKKKVLALANPDLHRQAQKLLE